MTSARLWVILAATLFGACTAPSPSGILLSAPPGIVPGSPLQPSSRPPDAECWNRVRLDIDSAVKVRAALAKTAPGLDTHRDAALAAAQDPEADLVRFGIPLLPDEVKLIDGAGTSFGDHAALSLRLDLVSDVFGGMWIPEPGVLTVALTDPGVIDQLRCFEPRNTAVRYVQAGWTLSALRALQSRIEEDLKSGKLEAEGVDPVAVGEGVSGNRYIISISVRNPSTGLVERLRSRYGDAVVVEEGRPVRP